MARKELMFCVQLKCQIFTGGSNNELIVSPRSGNTNADCGGNAPRRFGTQKLDECGIPEMQPVCGTNPPQPEG